MKSYTGDFGIMSEDFEQIETDRFVWRWNEGIRPFIRPLKPAKARAIYAIMLDYISRWGCMLSEEYFSSVDILDSNAHDTEASQWLGERAGPSTTDVLVAYRPGQAYLVAWDIFHAHWNDFCYPSSDDVIVTPLTEEWVLLFYHEEIFFWGKPHRKAVGRNGRDRAQRRA